MTPVLGRSYPRTLVDGFWSYKESAFAGRDELFEEAGRRVDRPPVFTKEAAAHNVVVHPDMDEAQARSVRGLIPRGKRHRWFRSMKSSQALAQTVFGNVLVLGKLRLLQAVRSLDGVAVFEAVGDSIASLEFEKSIDYLGEATGRTTEIDLLIGGGRRTVVECKLTESKFGECSRPNQSDLKADYCNGTYTRQLGRKNPCALSELGIRYWEFIPQVFQWHSGAEFSPCPLHATYQIVRNVLAACVDAAGQVNLQDAAAIVLVDGRNPVYQPRGYGRIAFDQARNALRRPEVLQFVTWQSVMEALRRDDELQGLTRVMAVKYGL